MVQAPRVNENDSPEKGYRVCDFFERRMIAFTLMEHTTISFWFYPDLDCGLLVKEGSSLFT